MDKIYFRIDVAIPEILPFKGDIKCIFSRVSHEIFHTYRNGLHASGLRAATLLNREADTLCNYHEEKKYQKSIIWKQILYDQIAKPGQQLFNR